MRYFNDKPHRQNYHNQIKLAENPIPRAFAFNLSCQNIHTPHASTPVVNSHTPHSMHTCLPSLTCLPRLGTESKKEFYNTIPKSQQKITTHTISTANINYSHNSTITQSTEDFKKCLTPRPEKYQRFFLLLLLPLRSSFQENKN